MSFLNYPRLNFTGLFQADPSTVNNDPRHYSVRITEAPINPYTGRQGELAHYFKFGEVAYGRRLVRDSKAPSGYSYTGAPVPLDTEAVRTVVPDASLADFPPDNPAYLPAQAFYECFVRLLNALNGAFNGDPAKLTPALSIMYELRLAAFKVIDVPLRGFEGTPVYAAPPFQRRRAES